MLQKFLDWEHYFHCLTRERKIAFFKKNKQKQNHLCLQKSLIGSFYFYFNPTCGIAKLKIKK